MNLLNEIVERKKKRLDFIKAKIPLKEIRLRVSDVKSPKNFKSAIKRDSGSIRLIAEIKKASPLRGIIRRDFNPITIASIYEKKAVDAISVITEEVYFQGSLEYMIDVRRVTDKPLLRKDFIIDEYQIYESKANGSDAILLIASILDKNQAAEYLHLTEELGLSALFEVHDLKELEMAFFIKAEILGINNRDLRTLTIDINTTLELKKEISHDKIVVSESGIKTREDVKKLEDAGIDSILVGTAFMEAEDIGGKIDELIRRML